MKKLIVIICAIVLVALSSCANKHYGEYGVVDSVEHNTNSNSRANKYQYLVGVRHPNNNSWGYYFYTNTNYMVGDTIMMVGTKKR